MNDLNAIGPSKKPWAPNSLDNVAKLGSLTSRRDVELRDAIIEQLERLREEVREASANSSGDKDDGNKDEDEEEECVRLQVTLLIHAV